MMTTLAFAPLPLDLGAPWGPRTVLSWIDFRAPFSLPAIPGNGMEVAFLSKGECEGG